MILYDPKTREEWLRLRGNGIGGSDAACVVGKNKYKSNVDLWMEKTGRVKPSDISDNPSVAFGVRAEPILRELFALTHPAYTVTHHPYRMYAVESHPYLYATLDGELYELDSGTEGVLEIKTCTIQNAAQWEEWDDKIPDAYYAQVLHQMAATEKDFVILYACLRYCTKPDMEQRMQIRHYRIDKADVGEDISYLVSREEEFWKMVQSNECPALILPEI